MRPLRIAASRLAASMIEQRRASRATHDDDPRETAALVAMLHDSFEPLFGRGAFDALLVHAIVVVKRTCDPRVALAIDDSDLVRGADAIARVPKSDGRTDVAQLVLSSVIEVLMQLIGENLVARRVHDRGLVAAVRAVPRESRDSR